SRTQVQTIYSNHVDSYQRMITTFKYPQGMQEFMATSGLLRDRLRVLDAGCGFGAATLALVQALRQKDLHYDSLDAFDLTPAMLTRYRYNVEAAGLPNVRVHQADVTALEQLPAGWIGYDLILAAGMLEHVPKEELAGALSGLRGRLGPGGSLVAFITRKSPE